MHQNIKCNSVSSIYCVDSSLDIHVVVSGPLVNAVWKKLINYLKPSLSISHFWGFFSHLLGSYTDWKLQLFALSTREHDKGPDVFFHTLYQLADQGLQFKVSVLGERFSEVPGDFFHCRKFYTLIEYINVYDQKIQLKVCTSYCQKKRKIIELY